MRSGNPALRAFSQPQTWAQVAAAGVPGSPTAAAARPNVMTVGGAINTTFILTTIMIAAAVGGWSLGQNQPHLLPALWAGTGVTTMAIWVILRFTARLSPYLAPVYAVGQGLFLGVISYAFEKWIAPGIVFQALLLTGGIMFAMLAAYKFGGVRLGSTAKRVVAAGVGGVMFLYFAVFVLQLLGVGNIPFIHELFRVKDAGWLGIGFSLAMVVLASLLLVWDFQAIEEGAQAGLPRYMEWYAAYCLLTTLVWLYIEILHLLAKLRND
jgi:uncharacterized YccA/Bax inhibitor family protein